MGKRLQLSGSLCVCVHVAGFASYNEYVRASLHAHTKFFGARKRAATMHVRASLTRFDCESRAYCTLCTAIENGRQLARARVVKTNKVNYKQEPSVHYALNRNVVARIARACARAFSY